MRATRYELRSVDLWAFTKVAFFVNLIIGFVLGLISTMFFGVISAILAGVPMVSEDFSETEQSIGALLGILPFLFAVGIGLFYTMLEVFIVLVYNVVSKVVGGFEFNLVAMPEYDIERRTTRTTTPAKYVIPPPPPPVSGSSSLQQKAPIDVVQDSERLEQSNLPDFENKPDEREHEK